MYWNIYLENSYKAETSCGGGLTLWAAIIMPLLLNPQIGSPYVAIGEAPWQ